MDADRIHASPYTDLSPSGLDDLFGTGPADDLVSILADTRLRAAA